jgi:hypothetical protein
MSDYFATVRDGLAEAVERGQHLRWYTRVRLGHGRALAVVVTALVVATPAVGAVSGWFSSGRPDAAPRVSPSSVFGVVKLGGARLLPIRVADPQGGPDWGLRLVRTDRGNTCLQLGRVKARQLGSLGIDDAWHNDHEFHTIRPNATYADACGSTDAAGDGFVSTDVLGESASANPTFDVLHGPQASGCKLRGTGGPPSWPDCPTGADRMIFYGLLGPDATSITYRKPDGARGTERTVGGVGAYLLVFTYDQRACHAYSDQAAYQVGCDGIRSARSMSPDALGAVTKITYRDGHSCTISPQPSQHCPLVGWVAFKHHKLNSADVAAPIHLRRFPVGTYACPRNPLHLPDGCNSPVIPIEWSFTARRAVTTTRSWYSWLITPSSGCAGSEGYTTHSRIHAGQTLRYSTFLSPTCPGSYHLTIGYTPLAPPGTTNAGAAGALLTGGHGSIIVGRATITIPPNR